MLNRLRRALGLHVHDWEEIATETHRGAKPAEFVQAGWRPWDLGPATNVVELKTFRCRICARVRTLGVRVG